MPRESKALLLNSLACIPLFLMPIPSFSKIETYQIDPDHTYPSFEADHLGGLSKWRGKINATEGVITIDNDNLTGTVEIKMDMKTLTCAFQGSL